MFIHRKLMTSCAVAALAFGLVACATSDDDNAAMDATEPMGPTADEQLATLRGEIAELRKQLGIEDDDDLGDSISDLQEKVADLKGQVEDQENAAAAAAAKAHAAKLNKLAMGLRVPSVQPTTDKPDTATDGDAPYAIIGWAGSSYSDGSSPIMAVVYNNKEAATPPVAFSVKYADNDADTDVGKDGVYTFPAGEKGELVEMDGLPTHASHAGVRVGPAFGGGGVRGKFNGVPGTFSSDESITTLTVGVTPTGDAIWTGGNLNFKPDSATAKVMTADDTYMNLGWWLNENADGDLVPMVAAWDTSPPDSPALTMNTLTGTATFMGIAVGKYTHKTINSIEGGHYNASAKLLADFGEVAAAGTLRGTIDGFMQDGQLIDSGWKVELGAASGADAFNPKMGAGISDGGAVVDQEALGTFGTQKTAGTWAAMFHADSRRDSMPGAVGGTFHVGEDGHPINMIGAFSASNQEADLP